MVVYLARISPRLLDHGSKSLPTAELSSLSRFFRVLSYEGSRSANVKYKSGRKKRRLIKVNLTFQVLTDPKVTILLKTHI